MGKTLAMRRNTQQTLTEARLLLLQSQLATQRLKEEQARAELEKAEHEAAIVLLQLECARRELEIAKRRAHEVLGEEEKYRG